jgi:hypothetical protein
MAPIFLRILLHLVIRVRLPRTSTVFEVLVKVLMLVVQTITAGGGYFTMRRT